MSLPSRAFGFYYRHSGNAVIYVMVQRFLVLLIYYKSKAYSRMSRPAPARCQFRYAVSSYVHGTCPCIYGIGKVGEQAEDMHNMVYALRDTDFSAGTVD